MYGIKKWTKWYRVWRKDSSIDLSSLNLSSVPLFVLDRFASSIEELNLDQNSLSALPKSFEKLVKLKSLSLCQNKLEELPEVVCALTTLETLAISGNSIQVIPKSIGQLTRLQHLNVSENRLDSLPVVLGNLPKLKSLDIYKNPLSALPSQVASAKRVGDVISFLRALGANQLHWNKVKVMVVGKEAVGKTSLIRCIQKATKRIAVDLNDVPVSTEGIDIERWQPKKLPTNISSKKKTIPEFFLWDLGGQEVCDFYLTDTLLFWKLSLCWNLGNFRSITPLPLSSLIMGVHGMLMAGCSAGLLSNPPVLHHTLLNLHCGVRSAQAGVEARHLLDAPDQGQHWPQLPSNHLRWNTC